MSLELIGVVIGISGALWGTRPLHSLLFDVSARDPIIYGAVTLGVLLIALAANFLPARRASAMDPMRALHFE
jgi:putative ABC transport system permease protein